MTGLNRQERRAVQRRRPHQQGHLVGVRTFLTYDELSIVEEALALWLHQTREDLDGVELTGRQKWGLRRGEKLRAAFSAELEDRPWHDIAPEREEPSEEGS